MNIESSRRLSALTGYPFVEIDRKVAELRKTGVEVFDFGVGDPTEPTPAIVRDEIKRAVDRRATSGYPSDIGLPEFREAIAAWMKGRFGCSLSSDREVCVTVGAKEAVFNFPEAFINPGDVVLVPNPGYPPYNRGTRFAEGEVHYLNLVEENGFLPAFDSIPKEILSRAKLMWINYPNNPTGVCAPRDFFQRVVEFGAQNGIIIASDEAYAENYFGEKPPSILEFAREGVCAIHSLSKRSCMTGYRVGWLAGDERIIAQFKKLKANIDSGTPTFVQDAAIVALSDERHVGDLRRLYKKKRDLICGAFKSAGLKNCTPDATLYIWQRVPDGHTSLSFAQKLLDPSIAAVVTPGNWVSSDTPAGNPGEGFVRLALVPTVEECEIVAERIARKLGSSRI